MKPNVSKNHIPLLGMKKNSRDDKFETARTLKSIAIFRNFVEFCFLYSDEVSYKNKIDHSTMLAAIKSVRKAFSTAAIKNFFLSKT